MSGSSDEAIVKKLVVQTKEETKEMIKSDSGTEIAKPILKNLVPKFRNNKLKYDPHQIISNLVAQNNGPFKNLHDQAKIFDRICTL